jgi:sulfatase maturation enzyme AslB (radical SAM superfamily)
MDDQQANSFSKSTKPFFSRYNVARFGFFLFGIPNNSFGSVDVTNQCNLRCDHCYFFEQDHSSQWHLEQWQELFEQMKGKGFRFYQCTWVGGEPLLRPEIIEMGRRYFTYNTVTTNGSIPLPDWKEVSWYISVDGGRQNHDKLRNMPGLYDTIRQNIERTEGLKITIAYCITSTNFKELDDSLAEWSSNHKVRNMLFSFYTPIRDVADGLWLESHEKDRVIDAIILKKHQYGDFILNTESSLRLMKSDRARSVTDTCPFAAKSFALNATGISKQPCMMGPKADCTRCGCVVPFYLCSLTDRKLIVREVMTNAVRSLRRGMAVLLNAGT